QHHRVRLFADREYAQLFALAIQLGQSPTQRVRNPTRVIDQQHQDWSIGVLKVVVAKRSRGL
ncbi:MAG TPA: hypothetical protein DCF78_05265, partial [Dehalococcoidia bacterium]|nr:hypothetical protein [Dehalococcoidia bacterium]